MDVCFDRILYVGSVRIVASHHSNRMELVRQHMEAHRDFTRAKPVLLTVSLHGIKVCSPDGTVVCMAHALRRISYATCDLRYNQFCFMAREPRDHFSNQYCHLFSTASPQQAEELNSIVGNAFRMAYAAQMKKQHNSLDEGKMCSSSSDLSPTSSVATLTDSRCFQYSPLSPPNNIPGLLKTTSDMQDSPQSTPTSDESNSPTHLNNCKRMFQQKSSPFIKKIPLPCSTVGQGQFPTTTRPTPEGCISLQQKEPVTVISSDRDNNTGISLHDNSKSSKSQLVLDSNTLSVLMSLSGPNAEERFHQSAPTSTLGYTPSSDSVPYHTPVTASTALPLLPAQFHTSPEVQETLRKKREEMELKSAPWFQAGIPREITLEVLSQETVGAFMVRESTTKPGCYALSVRVPKEFNSSGIAHYLILRTAKGYKIKGFTKEFSTLTALITHHSVMQELLPCPLSLSRYNPSFTKSDTNKDFADIDADPDYNTLADFRKMMADLDV